MVVKGIFVSSLLTGFLVIVMGISGLKFSFVSGESMEPNLHDGDKLLCLYPGEVMRGDIVIIEVDGENLVKRVVGIPGDSVYYNDVDVSTIHSVDHPTKVTLNENEYFVVGDNREVSEDSRIFGPIGLEQIKRKMVWRL